MTIPIRDAERTRCSGRLARRPGRVDPRRTFCSLCSRRYPRAAYRKGVVPAAPGVRVSDGDVVRGGKIDCPASAERANARARVGDSRRAPETAWEKTDDFLGGVGDERDERRSGRGGRVSIGGGCGGGSGASASPPAGGREPDEYEAPSGSRTARRIAHRNLSQLDETRDRLRPDRRRCWFASIDTRKARARGLIFRHPRRPVPDRPPPRRPLRDAEGRPSIRSAGMRTSCRRRRERREQRECFKAARRSRESSSRREIVAARSTMYRALVVVIDSGGA